MSDPDLVGRDVVDPRIPERGFAGAMGCRVGRGLIAVTLVAAVAPAVDRAARTAREGEAAEARRPVRGATWQP